MWWKKKKVEEPKKIRNVFTIPSEEAKKYLGHIADDVKAIFESENFMEASKRVKLPENATRADYEKLIKQITPAKVAGFLRWGLVDCYDNFRRIMACLMAVDFEEYKNKSIEEMCEDFATMNVAEVANLLRFFIH